jgi:DNA polymerase III alpha subunit (gram-positive type)
MLIIFCCVVVILILVALKRREKESEKELIERELEESKREYERRKSKIDESYLFPSKTNEPLFFIFDCETTGLPRFDEVVRIVQLSWIVLDKDFNLIKKANYYLDPGMHIPSAATEIHHITDEIIKERATPHVDVLTEFYNDLEQSKMIVAHNFKFDAERVDFETEKTNLKNRHC